MLGSSILGSAYAGAASLPGTPLVHSLDAHASALAIFGTAAGATAIDDRILLTQIRTSLIATAPLNIVVDWVYFSGTKTLPSDVVTLPCPYSFPRPIQVWSGTSYTPLIPEAGTYIVQIVASSGLVSATATVIVTGPGYRLLTVVEGAPGAWAMAAGGLGQPADALGLFDPYGRLIDYAYLNGLKTTPSPARTAGQYLFQTPATYGDYTIAFINCSAPLFVTGANGPYYVTAPSDIYDRYLWRVTPEPASVLEMEFQGRGNGWTIVKDWLRTPGIAWHRGLAGTTVADLTADVGTLAFTLDNSEKNSQSRVGLYSPDHADRRYGFYLNIGVRWRVGQNVRFTGFLNAIDPVPGAWGARTVSCEVVDWMSVADRTKLSGLPVMINATGDQVFNTLLASLQPSSQPAGTQVDIVAGDILPYTLDQVRDEETVLRDEIFRINQSLLSLCWVDGGGIVIYEARTTRANKTTNVDAFTDAVSFQMTHDRAAVVNAAQVTVHPRIPSTVNVVMFSLPAPVPLTPGVTFTVMGTWTDPANPSNRVGAASLVTIVPGTDYKANTASDGSGADITASVTIVPSLSGNATQFTISGSVAGFLTFLQQRGKPLYDYGNVVLPWKDTTSVAQFGESAQTLDMPYQADANFGLEVAQYTVFNGINPSSAIQAFTRVVSLADPIEAPRNLARRISDRIGITDSVTGISQSFFINAIDETETEDVLTTQWLLMPADTTAYWQLEIAGQSELGTTARLAFGLVLGHTDIAHVDLHNDIAHADAPHQDHTDQVPHTDISHGDSTSHADTAHTDVIHQDVAHGDVPFVGTHSDVAHSDIGHQDYHQDITHADVPHDDQHGDSHTDVKEIIFADHVDETGQPVYHFDIDQQNWTTHVDGWSTPYPTSSYQNPSGPIHSDGRHVDDTGPANGGNGTIPPPPMHDDRGVPFVQYHVDDTVRTHGDSHADIAHADVHTDVAHADVPLQNAHGDSVHSDVTHVDVAHQDVAHVDIPTHTDAPAVSIPHSDNPHVDANHGDAIHSDTHTDAIHGDLH